MILTSATFAQLLDIAPSRLHIMLADGSEVPREAIRSAKWSGGCNAGEDITLGSTVATHLEAEIDRTRLGGLDLTDAMLAVTLTLDGAEDEITCGVLQVEKVDGDDDILTITANDAMVYAFDQRYALDDEALGFDWEAGVDGVTLLDAICDELGITLATTDLPPILLQYQDCSGLTYREVLAFLACMWGKFARMDGTGQLVLGWYAAADRSIGPGRYYDGELKKAATDYTVEYIKCYSDHLAETLLCGDPQGARGISISCPWMTQEQLRVVWESIARFTYRPVSSLRFLGDPRLEPGDVIQVTDRAGETYSVPVMSITHEFDGGLISEIAAAGKSAASSSGASGDDKVGPVTRMIQRAEQALKVTLIKYQDRIQSMVQALDGSVSEITQKVDNITLRVEQKVGADGFDALGAARTGDSALDKESVSLYINLNYFKVLYCYSFMSVLTGHVLVLEYSRRRTDRTHRTNFSVNRAYTVSFLQSVLIPTFDNTAETVTFACADYVDLIALCKSIYFNYVAYFISGYVFKAEFFKNSLTRNVCLFELTCFRFVQRLFGYFVKTEFYCRVTVSFNSLDLHYRAWAGLHYGNGDYFSVCGKDLRHT